MSKNISGREQYQRK